MPNTISDNATVGVLFTQELESSVEISNITTTVVGASVTGVGGTTATFSYTPQSAGTDTGNIVITGTNDATATVPVTLTVTSPSQVFTISPDSLNAEVSPFESFTTTFTASEDIQSATFENTSEYKPIGTVTFADNVITLSFDDVGDEPFSGEISVVSVNSNTATIPLYFTIKY